MDAQRAMAELEARRKKGAVGKRLGGVVRGAVSSLLGMGSVPAALAEVVRDGFREEHASSRMYRVDEKADAAAAALAALSGAERRRAFETLLPRLAPSVEAAWALQVNRPYQTGGFRRPFRCPGAAGDLARLRGRWLLQLTFLLGEYDEDVRWVAAWAPHVAPWAGLDEMGWLLAGALDAGGAVGDEVLAILKASAEGEHAVGQMGRHVIRAMLSSSRPEAWEYVERLLLAAQRQEGLRQTVLETVDEAHPQAFRRMLRLVRDHDLARFSSVVRALDTWFGFLWDGASGFKAGEVIDTVLRFLDDGGARAAALEGDDPETAYLALWAIAFEDVDAAVAPAARLLASPAAEMRWAGAHLLAQSGWSSALPPLAGALGDPDLRVAARALDSFAAAEPAHVDGAAVFAALEGLMARLPKRSQKVPAAVWPWTERKLERTQVAAAMAAHAAAVPGERMLPYVRDLDPYQREIFLRRQAGLADRWTMGTRPKPKPLPASLRPVVLDLLGDASQAVRETAFEVLRAAPLLPDETDRLIELLDRKPADLRGGALARLRALPDDALLAAADRLTADASEGRRLAGLELLRDAAGAGRAADPVRARMEAFRAGREVSDAERSHLDAVLGERAEEAATLEDVLGLIDPKTLRRWPEPRDRGVEIGTRAAQACIDSLAALILAHQHEEVPNASGETGLLVEVGQYAARPGHAADGVYRPAPLPLEAVWKGWLAERDDALRDADGLELPRAMLIPRDRWTGREAKRLLGVGHWSAGANFLGLLLEWCVFWEPPPHAARFLADGVESVLAAIRPAEWKAIESHGRENGGRGWGLFSRDADLERLDALQRWDGRFDWWRRLFPAAVPPAEAERMYGLARWFQRRSGGLWVLAPSLGDFLGARRGGAAGVDAAELLDLCAGPGGNDRAVLRDASVKRPPPELAADAELVDAVERLRRRIVEVETRRGDRPTAASPLVTPLRWTGGLETLSRALPALGSTRFARTQGWNSTGDSRLDTLSHLVLRSTPRDGDTPGAFAAWAKEAKVKEARLVELAVYAPQWAAHVEHALGWPGLESAVWWVHAHTRDDRSWSLQELKEEWAAQVAQRTPLTADELMEGAVDVEWFHAARAALGDKRWAMVDGAARYASGGGGHTRAQLFARAMLGGVERGELEARIAASRHQDSVRAIGLVPLPEGEAGGAEVLERYRLLQEFRRGSRKFGSQRQASEGRAVAVAMANLARTAGYRDPQRLQWAMEREAVADLAAGAVTVERGGVSVSLSVDADGAPALSIVRAGKALKSVPAALKKDEEVAALTARVPEIRKQRSRMRAALEEAMCRGDAFTGAELGELLGHPVLAPALSRLVFVGEGTAGYPVEGGRALRDAEGALHAVGPAEPLRVAHPADLLARGDWSAWQRECYRAERVQPFKQLFRELYPLTETEHGTDRTRRYAGHQLNPRQALALLGGRGWVAHPDEGVHRTFHEAGLTAWLFFQEAFHTPADVEGLTLEGVIFTAKNGHQPVALDGVPARVFSEAMRDLDLAVSVAHQGGVDPEATHSTVEMRAALLRETCELLGLDNVEVEGSHARIRGELGSYAVHLGSAGAQVMPGTALFLVAVHSQHRGRLFLPFADDDPRTAEVLSKVLLLARDRQIKDPNLLDQIRMAGGGR